MSQTRHFTVFDGLALRLQNLLHFFSAAEATSVATDSATSKANVNESMSKNEPNFAEEAEQALNSVLFAIGAYGRYGLEAVAEKLFSSQTPFHSRSLTAYSDGDLRRALSKQAKRLFKEDPAEVIQLHRYLIEFSQNRIARAGD